MLKFNRIKPLADMGFNVWGANAAAGGYVVVFDRAYPKDGFSVSFKNGGAVEYVARGLPILSAATTKAEAHNARKGAR